MTEADLDAVREELAELEAEETRISTLRRHLHRQIDFGSATEETRVRERQVSDQRLELHRRIDVLRLQLGLEPGPLAAVLSVERNFLNDDGDDGEGHLLV